MNENCQASIRKKLGLKEEVAEEIEEELTEEVVSSGSDEFFSDDDNPEKALEDY